MRSYCFYFFNLSDADSQVLNGLPLGLVIEYYETIADALQSENALDNMFYTTIRNDQFIYAKILNGPDCYGIVPVKLVVNTLAPPNFEDENISLCEGASTTLSVANIYETYIWSNGDNSYTTTIDQPGIYTITVGENDCSATKTFIVITPDPPVITSVEIQDLTANENIVVVNFIGTGNYEFSLNGTIFQDSPYFSGVAAGPYTVYMRDKFGCGDTSTKITVVNFPKFFTPNNDGINDFWTIPSLKNQPNAVINIFDRFGKLILQFNGNSKGWDGKLNSKDLPSNDYWFVAQLESGKTVKGHFTLKR